MNKIFLTGRITKDIELKGNENKFLSSTIAVYDGKDKNNQDITHFFDFKAFNYCANKIAKYGTKGSKIAIEGSLKQDAWEDDNGQHYKVVVYLDNVEIIDGKKEEAKEEVKDNIKNDDSEKDLPW